MKMEGENFDDSCEISDVEDELDFVLHGDNLSEILPGDDIGTDSDDSDIIIVRKKRRIQIIESDSEEEDAPPADTNTWSDITGSDIPLPRINFSTGNKIQGPQIFNIDEPVEFFKLYFTEELVDEIVSETNIYATNKLRTKTLSQNSIWHSWRDTNTEEFWAFIGVILNMGTIVLPNLQDYWSTRDNTKIPFFSNVFTRKRFHQLFWMLHLKTVDQQRRDIRTRIQRVSNFLEYLNAKFAEYFIPGQNICVDESIVKFKGKISFITYNPNKPTKWGIRIYVLADSETGYVYNILPYYGSIATNELIKPELPVSTRIPLHLYNNLLNNVPGAEGYHMYTDRYYTSIVLAEELLKMKCHITGTIKINRKGIPDPIKKPRFGVNKSIAYKKGRTMMLSWKDKRVVTLLSTSDSAGFITKTRFLRGGEQQNVDKPKVVVNYTESMGGVDRADQYASTYCFLRKSLKWWRKMFFWGMEMSCINSYILYKCIKKKQK